MDLLFEKNNSENIFQGNESKDEMFQLLEKCLSKAKDEKTLNKVCTEITNFYKDVNTKDRVLNCLPIIIMFYVDNYNKEKVGTIIEACLLTIYNLSLSDDYKVISKTRVPNILSASIYHNPQILPIQIDSSEVPNDEVLIIEEKQFKPILSSINNEKRSTFLRYMFMVYFMNISKASRTSQLNYCYLCSKLAKRSSEVYVDSHIYIELLRSLLFIYHNGLTIEAYEAINKISLRADDDLLVDVIMLANSIKNVINHPMSEETKKTKASHVSTGKLQKSDNISDKAILSSTVLDIHLSKEDNALSPNSKAYENIKNDETQKDLKNIDDSNSETLSSDSNF